jgi:MFS family permease
VIAAPNLLFLIFPLLLPESPRWLVSKGRGSAALASIATAAKSNNLPPPGNVVLKEVVEGEQQGIASLAKQPKLLFRLFIMSLNWIVITMCFYGLSMNSGNQDLFIGLGTMAGVELVAYISTMFFMDACGRQPILSICQMLGGISCICAGFTPMSYFWVRLALALVGKAGASACFAIVFVYTAEMFPTPIRNSAVGICSTVARIGALSAPAIANLDSIYAPLPFLIMGGGAVVVGSLSFLLPETRGIALPETIEEAAALEAGLPCRKNTQ